MKRFNSTKQALRLEVLEDRRVLSSFCTTLDTTPVSGSPIDLDGSLHDVQSAAISASGVSGSAIDLGGDLHGGGFAPAGANKVRPPSAIDLGGDLHGGGFAPAGATKVRPPSAIDLGGNLHDVHFAPLSADLLCAAAIDVEVVKPATRPFVAIEVTLANAARPTLPGGWCGTPDLPIYGHGDVTTEHVMAVMKPITQRPQRPGGDIVIDPGVPDANKGPQLVGELSENQMDASAVDYPSNQMPVKPIQKP